MRAGRNKTETVDQCETMAEAQQLIAQYKYANPSIYFWISRSCTREWRASQ